MIIPLLLSLWIVGPVDAVPLADDAVIDKIVIDKSRRRMTVYNGDAPLKTYRVALGPEPIGPKQFQGDGKTPEGAYKVDGKNPGSLYHKNLGVSYPNAADRKFARDHGRSPGGDIKIHGLGKTFARLGTVHYLYDWTAGCIAVTNEEIDEIYRATSVGTLVQINP